jgi:hypothetical protein
VKRDFHVKVTDEKGHDLEFIAKDAEISDKTLATRVGVGPVKETIIAKEFTVKEKRPKKKEEK